MQQNNWEAPPKKPLISVGEVSVINFGTKTVNAPTARPHTNLAKQKYQSLKGNKHMTTPTIIRRFVSFIILNLPYLHYQSQITFTYKSACKKGRYSTPKRQ